MLLGPFLEKKKILINILLRIYYSVVLKFNEYIIKLQYKLLLTLQLFIVEP